MKIETYCAKSKNCKCTECKRHLNGFYGMYISISNDFKCEEELKVEDELSKHND